MAKHEDVVKGASFTDIQVKGPFKSWRHQHEFVKLSDTRTKLVDTIECQLPFHMVAKLAAGWSLKRDIKSMLDYRHAITKADLQLLHDWPLEPQTIAITGASGMIGQALTRFLRAAGHTVKHLVRKERPDWSHEICWDQNWVLLMTFRMYLLLFIWPVNLWRQKQLRWDQQKSRIRRSRCARSTQALATQLQEKPNQVHTFICASAIGIYPSSQQLMAEDGPVGARFF